MSKDINKNCRAEVRNPIDETSHIFSINQCNLVKCYATGHIKDAKPGSQPIKLQNKRMQVQYKAELKENK